MEAFFRHVTCFGELFGECLGFPQSPNSPRTVHKQSTNSPQPVPNQSPISPQTVPKQSPNSPETVHKQSPNSPQTVAKQSQNSALFALLALLAGTICTILVHY